MHPIIYKNLVIIISETGSYSKGDFQDSLLRVRMQTSIYIEVAMK